MHFSPIVSLLTKTREHDQGGQKQSNIRELDIAKIIDLPGGYIKGNSKYSLPQFPHLGLKPLKAKMSF